MSRALGVRRLLIVEDEAMQASIMAEILEEAGYEIIGPVRSLREAIRIAALDYFDAALLDVQLEGEVSLELATLLARRGTPVLFVTGHADPREGEDLARSGYLAKPYHDHQLVECVHALFRAVPGATA